MGDVNQDLMHAAYKRGPEEVAALLAAGADANYTDWSDYSVLMRAVQAIDRPREDQIRIVRLLLDHGADPGYRAGDRHQAVVLAYGADLVELLLDAGARPTAEAAGYIMYHHDGDARIRRILEQRGYHPEWEDSPRQVYFRIQAYEGNALWDDVLEGAILTIRRTLAELTAYRTFRDGLVVPPEPSWDFYAISRVNQLMLRAFQEPKTHWWAPDLTREQYDLFWRTVGMTVWEPVKFHPFYCEVCEVEALDGDAAPALISSRWPCLMFGDLMFSRAGVAVAAGREVLDKATTETSKLFWCNSHRARPHGDLSDGWGSNSQWRTRFRFDYRDKDRLHYNVGDFTGIYDVGELGQEEEISLLKYRCRVQPPDVRDHGAYWLSHTEDLAPGTGAGLIVEVP